MHDYVYPSVFFAYFLFALLLGGALFFFVRSFHDGYWGEHGEDAKFRMLEDDEENRKEK
jgi:hypothetical protein